jgi:hypothetical protein
MRKALRSAFDECTGNTSSDDHPTMVTAAQARCNMSLDAYTDLRRELSVRGVRRAWTFSVSAYEVRLTNVYRRLT